MWETLPLVMGLFGVWCLFKAVADGGRWILLWVLGAVLCFAYAAGC